MDITSLKALVALLPVGLLSGSVALFCRERNANSSLKVVGTGCLVVVVLTHISEALHLLPRTQWGLEQSVGRYIDLSSAVLGVTLFSVGYLLHTLTKRVTVQAGRHG